MLLRFLASKCADCNLNAVSWQCWSLLEIYETNECSFMKNTCLTQAPNCRVQDAHAFRSVLLLSVCKYSCLSDTALSLSLFLYLSVCLCLFLFKFTCDRHRVKCSSNYGTVFWPPTQCPLSPLTLGSRISKMPGLTDTHARTHAHTPRLLLQKEHILSFTWTLLDEASKEVILRSLTQLSGFLLPFSPFLFLFGHESACSSASHFVSMAKSWGWNLC